MSNAFSRFFVFVGWSVVVAALFVASVLLSEFLGLYLFYVFGIVMVLYALLRVFAPDKVTIGLSGLALAMTLVWFFMLEASNDRDWVLDTSVLPRISRDGDVVSIENFRDFRWHGEDVVEARWKTESFDLNLLNSLELMVEPFGDSELVAHVMLGFGFSDGRRLVVSVEARREKGEEYELLAGAARQFELIYIFASEEDIIDLRAVQRGNRVYAYPLKVEPLFMRTLFLELCNSANALHECPQFYATLRDNCATTLLKNFEKISPLELGLRYEVIFPAKLGNLIYKIGLMDTEYSLEDANRAYWLKGARGVAGS